MTNYDRLILELWTDGTITPEMALVEASKIYRKHLNPFIQFFDVGKELAVEPPAREAPPAAAPVGPEPAVVAHASIPEPVAPPPAAAGEEDELVQKLELPIGKMDLSVRASNCLESEGIQTIGDLVGHTEDELLKFKNFGRTSMKEVKKKLDDLGLSLGMDLAAVRGRKG